MAVHISARVARHDSDWNGRFWCDLVCDKPTYARPWKRSFFGQRSLMHVWCRQMKRLFRQAVKSSRCIAARLGKQPYLEV